MALDVIQVIEKLDSLGYIRAHRVVNNYYTIYCPFHNNGQERKPSFGVLIHEEVRNGKRYPQGWCHCFTCGHVSSLPEMITKILESRSITKSGLDWLIENIPGFNAEAEFEYLVPTSVIDEISNNFALDYIRSLTDKPVEYVSEEELSSYRYTVPYMYERKLTDEVIEKFDVGVDMNFKLPGKTKVIPCITYPVRDKHGRTLFICRRSIEGKLFNMPEDVLKPVYGLDMVPHSCKVLVICESIINALTCWTWGYPAVALLGTGTSYQVQQLKELGVPEYVICLDGDDAGKKGTARLKRALRSNAMTWAINMIPGQDVNSIDKATFEKLYLERE